MKCLALLILFLHAEINVSAPTVQSAGLKQPVTTYNNWASYDELSDTVRLTEILAMQQLIMRSNEAFGKRKV